MGHIQRRGDGRWRARYRETAGSKERSRTFPRRVDAERFLTGIEHSKLTGGYVDPGAGKVTFRTFAEQWWAVQLHRPGTAIAVEHPAAAARLPALRSALIPSGASVNVVQARLGHALAKTTLDVYGHPFPDDEDPTRAAMDLELGSPAS